MSSKNKDPRIDTTSVPVIAYQPTAQERNNAATSMRYEGQAEAQRQAAWARANYYAPALRYIGLSNQAAAKSAEENKGFIATVLDNIWMDDFRKGPIAANGTIYGLPVPGADSFQQRWQNTIGVGAQLSGESYTWAQDHRNQALTYGLSMLPGGTQTVSWDQAARITPGRLWVAMGVHEGSYKDYLAQQEAKRKAYEERVKHGELVLSMEDTPDRAGIAPIFVPPGWDIRNTEDEKWLFGDPLDTAGNKPRSWQAGQANSISGGVDAAVTWFLDPLVLAGKGIKVARYGSQFMGMDIVGQTIRNTNSVRASKQIEAELDDFVERGIIRGAGRDAVNIYQRNGDQLRNEVWAKNTDHAEVMLDIADQIHEPKLAATFLGAMVGLPKYVKKLHEEAASIADAMASLKRPNPYEVAGANAPLGGSRPVLLDELIESNVSLGGLHDDLIARDFALQKALGLISEETSPITQIGGRFGNGGLAQAWRAGKGDRDLVTHGFNSEGKVSDRLGRLTGDRLGGVQRTEDGNRLVPYGTREYRMGPEPRPSNDPFRPDLAMSDAEKIAADRLRASIGDPAWRIADKEGVVVDEGPAIYHGSANPIPNARLYPSAYGFNTTTDAAAARKAAGPNGVIYNITVKGGKAPVIADGTAPASEGLKAAAAKVIGTKLPPGMYVKATKVKKKLPEGGTADHSYTMKALDKKGREVGTITWDADSGLSTIEVAKGSRRKGIASSLWNRAQAHAEAKGWTKPVLPLEMDKEGRAWARSLNRPEPRANVFPKLTAATGPRSTSSVATVLKAARADMEANGWGILEIEKALKVLHKQLRKEGIDAIQHNYGGDGTITWLNPRKLRIAENPTAGTQVRTAEEIMAEEVEPLVAALTPNRVRPLNPVGSVPGVYETVYQLSKGFRKVAVWEWINGQRGSGWLTSRGQDDGSAADEWWASLTDSPTLRKNKDFVRTLVQSWTHGSEIGNVKRAESIEMDAFLEIARMKGLTTNKYLVAVEKAALDLEAQAADAAAIAATAPETLALAQRAQKARALADKAMEAHRVTGEGAAMALYKQLAKKRMEVVGKFRDTKGRAFGQTFVDPADGTLIKTGPIMRSQLETKIPIMDFKLADKSISQLAAPGFKSHLGEFTDRVLTDMGKNPVAARKGAAKVTEAVTWGLEGINSAWKAAVLMRLGYTQRNVFEGWLRTWAVLGMVPALAPSNIANGIGRVFPYVGSNARRARKAENIEWFQRQVSKEVEQLRPLYHDSLDELGRLRNRAIPAPEHLEVGYTRNDVKHYESWGDHWWEAGPREPFDPNVPLNADQRDAIGSLMMPNLAGEQGPFEMVLWDNSTTFADVEKAYLETHRNAIGEAENINWKPDQFEFEDIADMRYQAEINTSLAPGSRIIRGLLTPEDLPDFVYHVTTRSDAVAKDGALRMSKGQGGGLGGETSKGTVSFTTDRKTAALIRDDLRLYATIRQMAASQHGDIADIIDILRHDIARYDGDPHADHWNQLWNRMYEQAHKTGDLNIVATAEQKHAAVAGTGIAVPGSRSYDVIKDPKATLQDLRDAFYEDMRAAPKAHNPGDPGMTRGQSMMIGNQFDNQLKAVAPRGPRNDVSTEQIWDRFQDEYFSRRRSSTNQHPEPPIIMQTHSLAEIDPMNIDIIAVPKRNIPRQYVIEDVGHRIAGEHKEIRVHGDVPIGQRQLNDVKDHIIHDDLYADAQRTVADLEASIDANIDVVRQLSAKKAKLGKRYIGWEDAFAGAMGEIHRSNASNQQTMKDFFESRAARDAAARRLNDDNWRLVQPDEVHYFDELAGAAIQFRSDPLGARAIGMEGGPRSIENTMAWFKTDAGRKYAADMGLKTDKAKADRVQLLFDEADHYWPTPESMALAARPTALPPLGSEYRTLLGGRRDLVPVHGRERIETEAEKGDPYHRFINGVFKYLGSLPDSALVRQPFYNETWKRETNALYQKAVALGEDVTDAAVIKRIEETAHRRSLKAVNETLFTITRYSNPAAALRFVSPFFAAWENSMRTWARIIIKDPSVAARASILWDLPNNLGLVVDKDGNPVRSNVGDFLTGSQDQYVVIPKFISDFYRETLLAAGNVAEGLDLPVLPSALRGASVLPVKIPKASFNVVAPGSSPFLAGLGPTVTTPVGIILASKPDWQQTVHDFLGTSLYEQIVPFGNASGDLMDTAAPAFLRKWWTLWQGEGNDDYLSTLDAITVDAIVRWYEGGGKQDERPDPAKIKQMTDDFYTFSTVASLTLPVSITRMSDYQPMLDFWHKLSSDPTIPYREKVATFIDKFGQSFVPLTRSTSNSDIKNLDPTLEMYQTITAHSREIQMLTGELGKGSASIIAATVPNGKFNPGVYSYWLNTRQPGSGLNYKKHMTADEILAQDSISQMWTKYTGAKTLRDEALAFYGISDWESKASKEAGIYDKWKSFEQRMYADYGPMWTNYGPDGYKRQLNNTLAAAQMLTEDKTFMQSDLGKSAVWGSIAEYLQTRAWAWEAINAGADKAVIKAKFKDWAEAHKYSSVQFADFYDVYLADDDLTVKMGPYKKAVA